MPDVIYDCETYPNCFTLAAEHADWDIRWSFEISDYRNDAQAIIEWLFWLKSEHYRMVGFNNIGFDYPVLHMLVKMGRPTAQSLYEKARAIIYGQDDDRWAHQVFPSDRLMEQIDLFKIHHFDNKARSTSLKALEFNMRMDSVSDLPFPVGTPLNREQIEVLHQYNADDVSATKKFYLESREQIRFREELSKTHGRDFMNHNDVKIGKEIFQMSLESAGINCYEYGPDGRKPRQTPRPIINLAECVPPVVQFRSSEFERIRQHFLTTTVTETKGAFKLTARVAGLDFDYGTGGFHASVENEVFHSDNEWMIFDMDVTSLYPSIAIEYGLYPQHLGPKFVEVYRTLRSQRTQYKKGTPENAMLKLALNGVYGASNDVFSIFYDPRFTMQITISGQLLLSMLVEWLITVADLRIIQCNTDGVTVFARRSSTLRIAEICTYWEQVTKLNLEYVEYRTMAIADVNSYIAVSTDGKVKRKGRYEHDLEWHQDASCLVVPKVAEQVILNGAKIRETIESWSDKMDFMHRIKVPRGSRLILTDEHGEHEQQNTCRYYVAKGGGVLTKIMPPLAKSPDKWRRIGVQSGWSVCVCNDISDAVLPINYDYYVQEVEKLTLGLR